MNQAFADALVYWNRMGAAVDAGLTVSPQLGAPSLRANGTTLDGSILGYGRNFNGVADCLVAGPKLKPRAGDYSIHIFAKYPNANPTVGYILWAAKPVAPYNGIFLGASNSGADGKPHLSVTDSAGNQAFAASTISRGGNVLHLFTVDIDRTANTAKLWADDQATPDITLDLTALGSRSIDAVGDFTHAFGGAPDGLSPGGGASNFLNGVIGTAAIFKIKSSAAFRAWLWNAGAGRTFAELQAFATSSLRIAT